MSIPRAPPGLLLSCYSASVHSDSLASALPTTAPSSRPSRKAIWHQQGRRRATVARRPVDWLLQLLPSLPMCRYNYQQTERAGAATANLICAVRRLHFCNRGLATDEAFHTIPKRQRRLMIRPFNECRTDTLTFSPPVAELFLSLSWRFSDTSALISFSRGSQLTVWDWGCSQWDDISIFPADIASILRNCEMFSFPFFLLD